MLQRRGDDAGAAQAFAEAERLNKRKADAQAATFAVSVGLGRLKAQDLAGAIERFRDAVRLAPDYPEAHYHLGIALQKAGSSREAKAHLAEARRLNPRLRYRR
jgi:Flp pilus assembly protein TadD